MQAHSLKVLPLFLAQLLVYRVRLRATSVWVAKNVSEDQSTSVQLSERTRSPESFDTASGTYRTRFS